MVCGNKMERKELTKLEYNMIHALHLAGAPGNCKADNANMVSFKSTTFRTFAAILNSISPVWLQVTEHKHVVCEITAIKLSFFVSIFSLRV